jgi:protocatechuate 3,4-dioxygenase beta subunit
MNRRVAGWSAALLIGALVVWGITRRSERPRIEPTSAAPTAETLDVGETPIATAEAPATIRVVEPATDAAPEVGAADSIRLTLRGRVRFADGRPAAFASVRLHDREPPLSARRVARGEMMRPRDGAPVDGPTASHHIGDHGELPQPTPQNEEDLPDSPPRAPIAEVTADRDGVFEITSPTPGRRHLDAVAPSAWCAAPLELELRPEALHDGLELVLTDGASLRGRVVSPIDLPVAGARVVAATRFDPFMVFAEGGTEMHSPWEVLTDANGEFALAGVPPDIELEVFARFPGLAPSPRTRITTRAGGSHEIECRLLPGGAVEVVATDPTGAPAADLVVELRASEVRLDEISAGDDGLRGMHRRLDRTGRARFDGLAVGSYDVSIDREPWLPATVSVKLAAPGEVATGTLSLAEGLTLEGRVVASDGTPLEGARVVAAEPPSFLNAMKSARGAGRRAATTAADGTFRLAGLAKGSVELTARAAGYEQRKLTAEPGGEPVELVLPTRGAIEGIVMSGLAFKPITEFTLEIERRGDAGGGLFDFEATLRSRAVRLRFTHPQGRFRVTGIAPGEIRIAITAAGHGRHVGEWFRLADGATRKGIIATLGPEAVIDGLVVASQGQAPVASASVELAGEARDPMGAIFASMFGETLATTAEDGSFRIGGLAAGRHRLVIRKEGFVALEAPPITLAAGQQVGPVRFELSPGGEIHGSVLASDGSPRAAASVICQDLARMAMRSARTDAAGRYRLGGLAPGNYALTLMPDSMSIGGDTMLDQLQGQMETHTVKLAAGQSLKIDFGLASRGRAILTGTVLSGGQPLAQAMVQVIESGEGVATGAGGVALATSDADGRFRLERLTAGHAFVQVNVGDLAGGGMNAALHPVELRDGEVTEVTLRVPAAAVAGTIVAADSGAPLAGIAVYIGAAPDSAPGGLEQAMRRSMAVRTDADGKFRLSYVRPGAARLVAGGGDLLGGTTRDYAVTSLPLAVPDSGTLEVGAVRLPRAAIVAGTLVDASGAPLSGGAVFLRDPATGHYLEEWSATSSDANGEFEYVGVPEGSWDVVARAPGYAAAVARGVTARTGEIARTRLELLGGTEVFAELGDLPFSELLDADLTVDGPEGPIPLTLFGLSELTDALRTPFTPAQVRVGRFGAGLYRLRGHIGTRSIDAELVLAGEPVLHVKVDLD